MLLFLKVLAFLLALTSLFLGYYSIRIANRFQSVKKSNESWSFAENQYNKETRRTIVFIVVIVSLVFALVYLTRLCFMHNVL